MELTGPWAETDHSFSGACCNVSPKKTKKSCKNAAPNIGLIPLLELYTRITAVTAKVPKTLTPKALGLEAKEVKRRSNVSVVIWLTDRHKTPEVFLDLSEPGKYCLKHCSNF